ncbi:MAG TPA: GNAT family N-acetyltransferase [Nocardioides sp.]|uniref:GNAT family N-acetyltransferase n=1 Tax=Nocardioides sp. TaxID=35761 RepID=UPI002F3FDB72
MRPTLHTTRLTLEPVADEHLPLLVELNSDPEVMRFLIGRAATPEETYAEWERRRGPQSDEERGLGYWAGFETAAGGGFVGWWSTSHYAGDDTLAGLGYRLRREAWGRGLATEGCHAMLAHAFTIPGIERVAAGTMAVNTRSRRVMEKLGMVHVRTWHEDFAAPLPGTDRGEVGYELTRRRWADHTGGMSPERSANTTS